VADVRSKSVIESNFPNRLKGVRSLQRQILVAGLALGSSSVLLLSGCSSGISNGFHGVGGDGLSVQSLKGLTHGGQFPVSGSTVQLYEVASTSSNATGYASASTALGTSATTDSNGFWNYGSFTCANAADEIYVVSSQGNPGLAGGTNNAALALTAALGPCNQLGSISFIYIDEVTTVAMAYSLSGFSSDQLHIGTSKTNAVGLTNAFATVNNLVNLSTGQALTATPAYATRPSAPAGSTVPTDNFNSIVPYDLLNSLANVLATRVNSDGTTAFSNLFQYTGGSQSTPSASVSNTYEAALYIAHNPGLENSGDHADSNISAVLGLVGTQPPFGPALSTIPTDLAMTINYVGGGLGGVNNDSTSGATRFAIDQQGNLWIANPGGHNHSVTELNNLGAPLSPTPVLSSTSPFPVTTAGGFGNAIFKTPNYVAIDLDGDAWVTDTSTSVCIAALNSSGGQLTGSPFTADCPGGLALNGVAVDASNNIYAESQTSITSVSLSGAVRTNFPVNGSFVELDSYLGVDDSGNIWYIDAGNGHYGNISSSGAIGPESNTELPAADGGWAALGPISGSSLQSLWLTQASGTENVQPMNLGNTSQIDTFPTSGDQPFTLGEPSGIAVDGNGNYYFANTGTENFEGDTMFPNLTVMSDAGSVLSPVKAGYLGGSALMEIDQPNQVAIDQSGNVWVLNTNNANNKSESLTGGSYLGNGVNAANMTEFVGLAAPVNPVFAQDAANQTYGQKP
jgi:hypothetical protein